MWRHGLRSIEVIERRRKMTAEMRRIRSGTAVSGYGDADLLQPNRARRSGGISAASYFEME